MSRGWIELLRSLGDSLLGVAEAEAAALKGDLQTSGRKLGVVAALAAAALFVFFWVVGAAGFVLFQVLTLWLPGWAAAAIVLAVLVLVATVLALVTRHRLRAIEPPADTVRRHLDDHVAWWQSQVLVGEGPEDRRLDDRTSHDLPDSADRS